MAIMTVAVDFDGTLNTDPHAFPLAGEPNWNIINKVKKLKAEGWETILWTCRTGESLDIAVKATKEWGLEWDAINDHTDSQKKWWKGDLGKKVFANIYLDDRAMNVRDF